MGNNTYKEIDEKNKKDISRDLINVIGLDNMLYVVIHKMVCDCIDNDIPTNERREFIIKKVNCEIDKWVY